MKSCLKTFEQTDFLNSNLKKKKNSVSLSVQNKQKFHNNSIIFLENYPLVFMRICVTGLFKKDSKIVACSIHAQIRYSKEI